MSHNQQWTDCILKMKGSNYDASTLFCNSYYTTRHLSKLISDKGVWIIENSGNWIKFLPMEKHYYNTLIMNCTITIIKTKKILKQVKHEKFINVIIN
jgi:hypothetical protein